MFGDVSGLFSDPFSRFFIAFRIESNIFRGNLISIIRKILVSVKFLSAILGPEMAAPILWAPRISGFFLQENLHVHKIPRFRGGYCGFGRG